MAVSWLIVDGHSILFAWPELREVHRTRQAAAREMLCRRLRSLQDAGEDRVAVVFDGNGARVSSSREHEQDIQIIYSDRRHTADAIIERLVARYSDQCRITVATGDRAEQVTVSACGGWFISPDELRDRVERAEQNLDRTLRLLNRKAAQGPSVSSRFL